MKTIILLAFATAAFLPGIAQKKVGINTVNPLTALHVADSSVLFSATGPVSSADTNTAPPVSGTGRRMMWYPTKGAFRAGFVQGTKWDKINTGLYSFAVGSDCTASGFAAVAMGSSTAATGDRSFAIGYQSTASGDYSVAMGAYAGNNNYNQSFCFNGSDYSATQNTANKQMMMRFDNYTFYVASSASYAYLIPASNGWAFTSDINKKERFEELNGETVLKKISAIPFYSWNFKSKDLSPYRHYGIMAQDFYNAFGKDHYGTIGNDTTVSALDLLGVAYSGIKALEKRSATLASENEQLKRDHIALQNKIDEMENQLAKANKLVGDEFSMLKIKLNELMAEKQNAMKDEKVKK